MFESQHNAFKAVGYLIALPFIVYYLGEWWGIDPLWKHGIATCLGMFFGMRGVFHIFYNDFAISRIEALGLWRGGVIILIAVGFILAIWTYHDWLEVEWQRQVVTAWTHGIASGLIMQMVFNGKIAAQRNQHEQSV